MVQKETTEAQKSTQQSSGDSGAKKVIQLDKGNPERGGETEKGNVFNRISKKRGTGERESN